MILFKLNLVILVEKNCLYKKNNNFQNFYFCLSAVNV